jgi:hypothetical protein
MVNGCKMKIDASTEIQPPEISLGCFSEYGPILGNYPFDINEVEYKNKQLLKFGIYFCKSHL